MDLVEIDQIDGEAAEAVLDFFTDRLRTQYVVYLTFETPAQAALGEDVGPRTAPFLQRAADDFLGVPEAVDGGRGNPVDAEFERAMHGGGGVVAGLRSPRELPRLTATAPG